jgi:hypothetical protein
MATVKALQGLRCLGSRVRVWSGDLSSSSGHDAQNGRCEPQRVVVFLHGSGITAVGMEKWLRTIWKPPPSTVIGERCAVRNGLQFVIVSAQK